MRDIYKTAKKAQMAPVRGRVKAMMAQPRAVAQARKTARQTTGFQAGGKISTPMTHDSDFTRWFESQYGGTEKGKPHSTFEGRADAGRRYMRRAEKYWTKRREEEKKRKDDPHHPREKKRMGPDAPSRPRPKAGPPAESPREYQDPFKKQKEEEGMYVKKGGVMEKGKPHSTTEGKVSSIQRKYKRALANVLKNKDRLTTRDIERAEKLTKGVGIGIADSAVNSIDKMLKILQEDKSIVGKKKGGKVDKKWIQKAVNPKHKGYCTPMTKKTCTPARKRLAKLFKSKAKKGWANGGTVVMPTVGNDVRTRAYKHGALIHPRPKPTTVAHGRGVGIAKRGW